VITVDIFLAEAKFEDPSHQATAQGLRYKRHSRGDTESTNNPRIPATSCHSHFKGYHICTAHTCIYNVIGSKTRSRMNTC